jgi:hypothetical protein
MLAAVATAASFHRKAPRALGGRKRDLRASRDKFATRRVPRAASYTPYFISLAVGLRLSTQASGGSKPSRGHDMFASRPVSTPHCALRHDFKILPDARMTATRLCAHVTRLPRIGHLSPSPPSAFPV